MSYHPLFFNDTVLASLEGSDVQSALRKRRYSEVEAFNRKFVDDVSAVLELEVRPPKKIVLRYYGIVIRTHDGPKKIVFPPNFTHNVRF